MQTLKALKKSTETEINQSFLNCEKSIALLNENTESKYPHSYLSQIKIKYIREL